MTVRAGFARRSDRFVLKLAFVMIDGVAALVIMLVAVSVGAGFDGVNRFFVRGFGFDVGTFLRAQSANFFDGFDFFHSVVGDFDFIDGVDILAFLFVLFLIFFVVFIERGATNDGVGGSVRLNFVLLRFDDARGESGYFFIAEGRFGSAFFMRFGVVELVSFFAIRRGGDWALERCLAGFRCAFGFGT